MFHNLGSPNFRGMSNISKVSKENHERNDFSEIRKIGFEIEKCKEAIEDLEKEIAICYQKIKKQRELIHEIVCQRDNERRTNPNFLKALKYIEKFMKKDSIPVLNLLVTKKQCDVYYDCVQLLESVDNELKELKSKLEQERITPLEDKIEEMENQRWELQNKQRSLEKSYCNHPLYMKYETEKRNQEQKGKKL